MAIGVHYLMGWAMATDPADRSLAEWPPHPDRVFMALVAAHFETDGGRAERDALRWLEEQGAPTVWASDATTREPVTTYVPANDIELPKPLKGRPPSQAGLQLLPETRLRNARHFPVAIPHDPRVFMTWPGDPPEDVRHGLEGLCAKVVRVGHSASLVQAWVENDPPPPNLVPTQGVAPRRLRVTGPGRLDHLERQYANGFRPERSLWWGYTIAQPPEDPPVEGTVFDDRLVILRRVDGHPLGLESTLLLLETLRRTLMKGCPQPVPEWVSGHTHDRRPTQRPHLAFLPLPYVHAEHADGHLLGVALAVPREVPAAEVGRCLNPVIGFNAEGTPSLLHLFDGTRLDWWVELERRESSPLTLQSWPWTAPARRWATVTPLVFDRHAKGRDRDRHSEEVVGAACERVGLPRPAEIAVCPVSLHVGVPHRRDFPVMRRKSDNGPMYHTHVVLTFERPVRGPVLLGAGRYLGYGLFRPVRDERGNEWML